MRVMKSFMSILFSLYLFMSIYAIIGQGLYCGVINLNDGNDDNIMNSAGNILYYQLNFNDTFSSILTLFCILTSNNWNSTTDMYAVLGDSAGPYWFFSIYFILSIMVVLNIVISFIMEIYSSIEEENEPRQNKQRHLQELSKLSYHDFNDLIQYYRRDKTHSV